MRETLRTRRAALIRRGEATVEAAAYQALTELTARIGEQLWSSGMVAHGLPAGLWESILAATVEPAVRGVYTAATSQRVSPHPVTAAAQPTEPIDQVGVEFLDPAEALGPSPTSVAADDYMAAVRNRLVGVSDTVYDAIVAELQAGREAQTVLDSGAIRIGESIPQLAARVDALLGDAGRWRNRAVTIARTETIGANNAGARYAATSTASTLGVDEDRVAKEWLATDDSATRDTHAEADGQVVVGMDTPFIVGGSELQEPGDADGDPEETINCVVGSTQVEWPGQVVHAATRRTYRGTFVHLRTARGHDLTVTPNHPILTPLGYVAAESVRVGQDVLATLRPPAPEVQDGPPSIEQVHRAAQQVGTTRRVRGTRVDFHGDGTDAEVEVVRPDRNLTFDRDPETLREQAQGILVRLSDRAGALAGAGGTDRGTPPALGGRPHGSSRAAGGVGSSSAGTTHLWGHAGGVRPVGLTGGADGEPEFTEPPDDERATDPEVARHLEHALAAGMTPCEVVEVEVYTGSHDVFNLQTSDAWYVGSGVAQHNCRCTCLYHYPGDPDYPDDAAVTAAASASLYRTHPSALHTERRRQETPMTEQTTLTAAADGAVEEHTSVVVVALPAADDPCNTIGGEQKHSTLLYLGDVPESDGDTPNALLTPEFQTALTAAVTQAASMSQPFDEDVDRIDSLGDDGARVWILKDGDLASIRAAIIAADPTIQPALDGVTQFPDFTPHVTIDYPADAPADAETEEDDDAPDADDQAPDAPVDTTLLDPAVETAATGVTSIAFDRLAIWWAGAQTEYPLAAEGDTPVHQEGDAVTAAAVAARASGQTYEQIAATLGYPSAAVARAVVAAAGDAAPVITADMEPGDPAPMVNPMAEEESESDQFYGVAVVEDSQTGDGRVFGPESIIWDSTPLPMPLGWQVADAPGHDGSVVCGRIDAVVRFGNLIGYTGTWDVDGYGWETRRLVEGRFLRGLSVDTDDFDAVVVDSNGNILDPMAMMFGDDEDAVLLVQKARLRSAAMCRVPAFTEAFIANGSPPAGWAGERPVDAAPAEAPAPEDVTPALVASAVRANLPELSLPSLSDFSDPGLVEDTRLTVTDDGRVFGHLAAWGTCHIGVEGYCQEPPVSDTNYAYFLTGAVKTAGGLVAVGQLTMDTGHPALSLSASQAIAHYDNTGAVIADVAVGNDGIGIWFSGRVRPGTTPEQVYALRASGSVSGDWRPIGTCAELVAALIVNTPGFPIPAPAVAASAAGMAMVASGVVRPPVAAPAVPGALPSAGEFTAAVAASLALLGRRDAAAARVRDRRRTNSAARYAVRARETRVTAAAARLNRKG